MGGKREQGVRFKLRVFDPSGFGILEKEGH